MPPPTLLSARRNYRTSRLVAARGVREAQKARRRGGIRAMIGVVMAHQILNAQTSDTAVTEMLAEQDIDAVVDALVNIGSYASDPTTIEAMLTSAETERAQDLTIESILQDSARAAEQVAVATRPDIWHVRHVNVPCCARCAILAGRIYRWSTGFERHPGCDCSMIPTTVSSPFVQDPEEMVRLGQVRGLSKADMEAFEMGAELDKLVNVRKRSAGLLEAGHALTRGGARPTPAGIFRIASDRGEALQLLQRFGYVTV